MPTSRYVVFLALATVGLSVDLATKSWIFAKQGMPYTSPPLWIWPEVLSLETSLNEGALFGIGQGLVPVFATLSVVAVVGIVTWLFWFGAAHDWMLTVALGCVTGGIFGNLYDRIGMPGLIWHFPRERAGEPVYAVRDWIHFQIEGVIDWPLFNVADSLLVCGVAILMLHAVLYPNAGSAPQKSTQTAASP